MRRGRRNRCATCGPAGTCSHAARTARDPLELELPERRVVLNEQGQITEIALRERLDAHRWSKIS